MESFAIDVETQTLSPRCHLPLDCYHVIIYNTCSEFMYHKQPWQVTLFLTLFKKLAQNCFTFADREESLDTLAKLGITVKQAKEEILGLTYQDYYKGPIPDISSKGGVYWEFGKTVCGKQIFMKLKADTEHGVAICFSFHIPNEPLEYPYGKGGERR